MNKKNGNILIGALAFGVLVYLLLSGRAERKRRERIMRREQITLQRAADIS